MNERKRSRDGGNQLRPSGCTGRTSLCQPWYQFLSGPGSREDQAVGCRGPFSKALFTPLFPRCPQIVGSGRRTTKKPGQGDASLLVLEPFLRAWDPHQDPRPQLLPPAGYTLSQGYLFHQLLQREIDDDDDNNPGGLELAQTGLGTFRHRVRGEAVGEASPVTSGRGRQGRPPQPVAAGARAGSAQQLSPAPPPHTEWLGPVSGH